MIWEEKLKYKLGSWENVAMQKQETSCNLEELRSRELGRRHTEKPQKTGLGIVNAAKPGLDQKRPDQQTNSTSTAPDQQPLSFRK